jgi:hypothetical protein
LGSASFDGTANLRFTVDIGALAVTAVAALITVIAGWSLGWFVLALAAIVVFLATITPDGLLASHSSRKYWGWVPLALGILALVWLLGTEAVRDVAAYVLPPAGALLLIAAAAW